MRIKSYLRVAAALAIGIILGVSGAVSVQREPRQAVAVAAQPKPVTTTTIGASTLSDLAWDCHTALGDLKNALTVGSRVNGYLEEHTRVMDDLMRGLLSPSEALRWGKDSIDAGRLDRPLLVDTADVAGIMKRACLSFDLRGRHLTTSLGRRVQRQQSIVDAGWRAVTAALATGVDLREHTRYMDELVAKINRGNSTKAEREQIVMAGMPSLTRGRADSRSFHQTQDAYNRLAAPPKPSRP
jgi:hypothetical protein